MEKTGSVVIQKNDIIVWHFPKNSNFKPYTSWYKSKEGISNIDIVIEVKRNKIKVLTVLGEIEEFPLDISGLIVNKEEKAKYNKYYKMFKRVSNNIIKEYIECMERIEDTYNAIDK